MQQKGFTLIEIIIVITIIAIMSAVVVLNVSAPNFSRFKGGAEKFSSTLSILADEAIYSGDVISCNISQTNMTCSRYHDGEWVDMDLRRVVSWGWPKDFSVIKISVNGVPIKDKQTVQFFPSGDNVSLSLEVTDGVYTAWVDSDMAGRFKVSI